MNWHPFMRLISAFLVYVVLVAANFAGISPVAFALFTAIVLSAGLWVHSLDQSATDSRHASLELTSALSKPLLETEEHLKALESEIDELQTQFVRDSNAFGHHFSSYGSGA